jgi:hypothetical protein
MILTAASMKMAIFWVITPCRLEEIHQQFTGTCCFHYRGDVGGSQYLRNVGELLPKNTAL